MTAVRVDVVIPCWGTYVETLPRCLRSVPPSARAVVVGDAESCAVAEAHGVRAVPLGSVRHVGAAREVGRLHTVGDALCFLDADDTLRPRALEAMAEVLVADPSLVAVSASLERSSDGTRWPPERLARLACRRLGGPVLLFRNVLTAVGGCLVRRSAVEGVRLFPTLDDEDWHAAITLRALGPVRFLDLVAVRYDTSAGSVSRRHRDEVAMRRSHRRLVRAATGAVRGPALTWRLADVLARPVRRRDRRRRAEAWRGVDAR